MISPKMIEAGERVILEELGGADLGGLFSASELAKKVYLAMQRAENELYTRAHDFGVPRSKP